MENTTKALIIAAAVLIVIVLAALGVLLIRNVSNTSDQAQDIGDLIGEAAGNASSDVVGGTKRVIISQKKFNSFIDNFSEKYSVISDVFNKIENEQNKILSDQISVEGYLYIGGKIENLYDSDFNTKKRINSKEEFYKYVVNTWINKDEIQNQLTSIGNPTKPETLERITEELTEVYTNKMGEGISQEDFESKARAVSFFGYDEWGYINKMVYIAFVNI